MTQTFESGYASTLSQKFSSTDTTMYVATPPTVTAGRVYLTDGSQKERVEFTGVSGSTLTWCVRGLSKTADPSTAWVGLNRLAGNPVVLVAMHDQLRDKNQATEALIYGKTYATTAARDTALWGDGAATHPYTNVYVTATWLHYNYNMATWQRVSVDTGVSPWNMTTTAAGLGQTSTDAHFLDGTVAGATGAQNVITNAQAYRLKFYDCTVAATWGDYATIGAAITAGKKNIFVKNGNYTETSWTTWTANIQITGESKEWVTVTFSNTDAHNTCYIWLDTCTGFRVNNISFVVTVNDTNLYFLYGSSSMVTYPFRFENCKFTIDCTWTSGTKYFLYNFAYTAFSYSNLPTMLEKDYNNGFFDCEFYSEYAGNNLRTNWSGFHYYKWCSFATWASAGRMNFIWVALLRDCNLDVFSLGLSSVSFDRTVVNVKDTGKVSSTSAWENWTPTLYHIKDSHIIYNGTLSTNTSLTVTYWIIWSYITVQWANIALSATWYFEQVSWNRIVTTWTFTSSQKNIDNNRITCSTATITIGNTNWGIFTSNTVVWAATFAPQRATICWNNISWNCIMSGTTWHDYNLFSWNFVWWTLSIWGRYNTVSANQISWNITFAATWLENAFTGNRCWTITVTAGANYNVITGNQNGDITDWGTGTVKSGNRA